MAYMVYTFSADLNAQELVPAIEGRRTLVTRMIASTRADVALTISSDGGTPAEQILIGPVYCGASVPVVVDAGREGSLVGDTAKPITLTAAFEGTPSFCTVMLWYEIVT